MLRPARDEDRELVRRWRNHPAVRAVSFTRHEITAEEHAAWWERVAADDARHVYVYELDGVPHGAVSYDIRDDGSAIWGFYLDRYDLEDGPPVLRALGEIFEQGIDLAFDELGVRELGGEVLVGNRAVRALHARHRFEESAPYERLVDDEVREAVRMTLTPERRRRRRT